MEAKQNQELWERSQGNPCKPILHKSKNEIRYSALLRIYVANNKLSNTNLAKLHKLIATRQLQKRLKHTDAPGFVGFHTRYRALTVAPGFEGLCKEFPLNDWPCGFLGYRASDASCSWFCRVSFNSYA